MINYVIYSNTDYLDILKIQTEFTKNLKNRTLLINQNDLELSNLYENFNEVVFYNDHEPYASRLLNLSKLGYDYILFIHDIDILININEKTIDDLIDFSRKNKIDRIDLQWFDKSYNPNSKIYNLETQEYKFELVKQDNPNGYIYNVNPSIWKLSSFIDLMFNFRNENYRTIEGYQTQLFAKKLEIYKLYLNPYLECGYFKCLPFFIFLHITHGGKLLPKENESNGLTQAIQIEYEDIIKKFKFNEDRIFRLSRW
jgi:hypothetical protein